jgi:hypothetical protein
LGLAACLLLLAPPQSCRADLLPIGLDPNSPVISSFNGSLSYNASISNFHSDSIPLAYTAADGTVSLFSSGHVTIDLMVNPSGQFVSNGSGFTLTGSLNLNGTDVSGTLLTGQVVAFGADPAGPPTRDFNVLFDIEGGLLTQNIPLSGGGSEFGGFPVGSLGGSFLFAENVTSGTLGDFTHNFSSNSVKDLEFATPEPRTVVMALIGAGLLIGFAVIKRRALRPI